MFCLESCSTVSNNYDDNVVLESVILDKSTGEVVDPSDLLNYGFIKVGNYEINYSSVDSNDNNITKTRDISVIDTIPPQLALITHDFMRNEASLITTNPKELGNKAIIDDDNPMPNEIVSSLSNLTGWIGNQFDPNHVITLESPQDFYVFAEPNKIKIAGHPNPSLSIVDELGRTKSRMSAFYIEDNEIK